MEERHKDAVSEILEGDGGLTDKIEDTARLGMDYGTITAGTYSTSLQIPFL